jgi:endonuclease/exonuclease/phosphatase (EEP) superfamily protein YafD
MTDALNNTDYWIFAPGYQSRTDMTGVMILSTVESTSRCQFSSIEPWLGTPKATGIATYRLTNSDVNLLVINIHGINFTIGTAQLEHQLQQLDELISMYQGPVILAGDFNTWKKRRSELLGSFVQQLDMEAVEFPNDQRVTAFGNTLDHMFVRNLSPVSADTLAVDTSDHNPMSVELRFQQ